ncbi:GNAT family N-acetyltransferase [Streptomyces sp. NPDC088725]|uniref:GNAT family N-acetyltransferase n=1 Tax=Streptomyces sp. NPDC088725 TaxID=3365873 RepID=UPI00381F5F55
MTMIRPAALEDLDTIVALHTAARATYYAGHIAEEEYAGPDELARSRAGWHRAVARGEGGVLCAEAGAGDGVVIAGIAAFRVIEGDMLLSQFHVDPAHWNRGIGSALHTAVVAAWRQSGVSEARLGVYEHNLRAQRFYARHGWRPDEDAVRAPGSAHLSLRLTV